MARSDLHASRAALPRTAQLRCALGGLSHCARARQPPVHRRSRNRMELRRPVSPLEPHRASSRRRHGRGPRQPGAAARLQHADARSELDRGDEGGRDRRNRDAVVSRRGTGHDRRKSANRALALRWPARRAIAAGNGASAGFSLHDVRRRRTRRAHEHEKRCLRRGGNVRARRRHDRLHVGNDRQTESGDALSPRRSGDLR